MDEDATVLKQASLSAVPVSCELTHMGLGFAPSTAKAYSRLPFQTSENAVVRYNDLRAAADEHCTVYS